MALFRKRKTVRRCRTLAAYVNGIDDRTIEKMASFLLEDKRNTVQATRSYLMFVNAIGVIVLTMPVSPARDDFEAIAISSSWAKVARPYSASRDNDSVGSTSDSGSGSFGDDPEDATLDAESWTTFGDSDGSSFTNNNNNNNNNNG